MADFPPKTVCFTGHRVIPEADCPRLVRALDAEILRQSDRGATVFRAGGALGFDTLAALSVLSLRRSRPEIRLELILPCPSQTKGWNANEIRLYEQICEQADAVRYAGTAYYPGILQLRNRLLVEGADVCVAYLLNSRGGGTAYTASLALRAGLEFVNLAERSGA